jgi:hypothetical protein
MTLPSKPAPVERSFGWVVDRATFGGENEGGECEARNKKSGKRRSTRDLVLSSEI